MVGIIGRACVRRKEWVCCTKGIHTHSFTAIGERVRTIEEYVLFLSRTYYPIYEISGSSGYIAQSGSSTEPGTYVIQDCSGFSSSASGGASVKESILRFGAATMRNGDGLVSGGHSPEHRVSARKPPRSRSRNRNQPRRRSQLIRQPQRLSFRRRRPIPV